MKGISRLSWTAAQQCTHATDRQCTLGTQTQIEDAWSFKALQVLEALNKLELELKHADSTQCDWRMDELCKLGHWLVANQDQESPIHRATGHAFPLSDRLLLHCSVTAFSIRCMPHC